MSERLHTSMGDIESFWSYSDMEDAHAILDAYEDAEKRTE
jgi:hypothetical protein